MKRLALVLLGGLTALLYRKALRVEQPVVEQKKLAWGHFHREIEEDARRRLALAADRRRSA